MTYKEDLSDEFDLEYPEIELETDDLKLIITLKKDYSKEKNLKLRKKQFFNDLESFIEEFRETPESNDESAKPDAQLNANSSLPGADDDLVNA